MNILITGGMGYIGSHLVASLLETDAEITILDNLINSDVRVLDKLKIINNRKINFVKADINDQHKLQECLINQSIDIVIHAAGLKSVEESMRHPEKYFYNNISGTISMLNAMSRSNVKKLIFSSSATVYSEKSFMPLQENSRLNPRSPYGESKLAVENILKSITKTDNNWKIAIIRYFNPVGAHSSSLIGEIPIDKPQNLMPILVRVAIGEIPFLSIYGDDYETKDGTAVRDYIHITDLVHGHINAIHYLQNNLVENPLIINLGTGKGSSVLDLVHEFESVNNVKINYKFEKRRKGDVPVSFADPSKAKKILNWKAKHNLREMCESSWNFYKSYEKLIN